MTYKSAVKSYVAASKRVQRQKEQRIRAAAKMHKQHQKAQELHTAAELVAQHNEYISILQGIHKDTTESLDWLVIAQEPEPIPPILLHTNEEIAKPSLQNFKPSVTQKLFGGVKNIIKGLEDQVQVGKKKDDDLYAEEVREYDEELLNWKALLEISTGILSSDPQSYPKALEFFKPFSNINDIGSSIQLAFSTDSCKVELHVKGKDVIPDFTMSLMASGKLSKKEMSVSKYNQLYQDYVCSCIHRIGRELYAILPIQHLLVHAVADLLNPATGLIETQTIVSVYMPRQTHTGLNYDLIDPTEAMKNFNHKMKFSKTNGFTAVEKVVLPS